MNNITKVLTPINGCNTVSIEVGYSLFFPIVYSWVSGHKNASNRAVVNILMERMKRQAIVMLDGTQNQ